MSDTYAEYQKSITPGPLRGEAGEAWAGGLGSIKDHVVADAKDAVKARFVDIAPTDALPRLAADRKIDRAPDEAADSWRERIRGAWESWSWLGTRYGITRSVGLLGYGYPSVWPYREFHVDSDTDRWARVIVVFRGLHAWDAGSVWDGDDVWDDDRAADAIEAADPLTVRPQLRAVLRQWINARDVVDRVVIAFGSLLWDLDSLWDGDDVWDVGGETVWQSVEWDSAEDGAVWDAPLMAWDAFC